MRGLTVNENSITTSEIKVKQWFLDKLNVYCRPVHPGVPDSEAGIWTPAHEYQDGWEFILKDDLTVKEDDLAVKVDPIFTATEYESLVNIMAFFDWDTFKKFETLDYNDGDKDLDLDVVKEYVIDSFRELVTEAQHDDDDYKWSEGCYKLRFEYRKDIGLHLMYVPLQEGDD